MTVVFRKGFSEKVTVEQTKKDREKNIIHITHLKKGFNQTTSELGESPLNERRRRGEATIVSNKLCNRMKR